MKISYPQLNLPKKFFKKAFALGVTLRARALTDLE